MTDCVNRIPEEFEFRRERYGMIMREILTQMKPYLDVGIKVIMEEYVWGTKRQNKESMSSYITRKTTKRRDFCSAFGV